MVLWGIERSLDEHLWLGEDGRLGSDLVQLAGVLLVVGGAVILLRTRGRWKQWLVTHQAPTAQPRAGCRPEAAGLNSSSRVEIERCAPDAVALALDGQASPSGRSTRSRQGGLRDRLRRRLLVRATTSRPSRANVVRGRQCYGLPRQMGHGRDGATLARSVHAVNPRQGTTRADSGEEAGVPQGFS